MARWRTFRRTCLLGLLWAPACAPPPPPRPRPAPAAAASTKPAAPGLEQLTDELEPLAPELRTGRITPVEHSEPLDLTVRRHAIDGDDELLELVLPDFAAEVPGDSFWLGTEARITGSSAPFQLVSRGKGSEMLLWLRRPKSESKAEVMGDAYTPAVGAQPGHHFRFRAPAPSSGVSPELPSEWAAAAVDYLAREGGTFGSLASRRLHQRYRLKSPLSPAFSADPSPSELVDLMDTFAGRAEVQAALALHQAAVLSAAKQARSIPLAALKAPELSRHPWAELLRRLGGKQPDEPLARAVPADFYFVRSNDFARFNELLGYVRDLGAPAVDAFDRSPSARGTLSRYLTELGVETSDLTRVLGPEVVQDFALAGSDPYVHEGSDVTLVFRLKSPLLFRAALLKALGTYGSVHGGIRNTSFTHEGIRVEVARSADGRVRQHHAVVGDWEVLSNSPSAIKRVVSTILGKAPSLADEPDFRYMLARDADEPADVLAFIGDRFVASVVGPAQKVAEARRQVALSELMQAPVAALLYGWVHGKSPGSTQELFRSGLLLPSDLRHASGSRIDFAPGSAPHSLWGSPAALEPLCDLPPVTRVSSVERDSYAEFAREYQARWAEYIDPIALRVSGLRSGDRRGFHVAVRVLPLTPGADELRLDLGGDGRVAPRELASGARFSFGIGEQAPLRQELGRGLDLLSTPSSHLKLDWLGDYAVLGLADRNELLTALRASREGRDFPFERPASAEELGREGVARGDLESLTGLPLYLVVGLRSRVATAVALGAVKQLLDGVAPGAVQWAPFASYRGVQVVRVSEHEHGGERSLYYALAGDDLIVAFNRAVLRGVIDQVLDGQLVQPLDQAGSEAARQAGQVVLELSPSKKGALRSALAWALSTAAAEGSYRSRAAAAAVLRGVPESAHDAERSADLSLAYLGAAPLTPDGHHYALSPEGIRDPLRGTAHDPEFPQVPTPGSSVDAVLGVLGGLRGQLAFEREPRIGGEQPALRSLRAGLDLWLR